MLGPSGVESKLQIVIGILDMGRWFCLFTRHQKFCFTNILPIFLDKESLVEKLFKNDATM